MSDKPPMTNNNPIMQFFEYKHLPPDLAETSAIFKNAADYLVSKTDPSAEQSAALRHLLEAKDAAVRARMITKDRQ